MINWENTILRAGTLLQIPKPSGLASTYSVTIVCMEGFALKLMDVIWEGGEVTQTVGELYSYLGL